MDQAVIQDRMLDRFAADLAKLLGIVAHHVAGLADIAEIGGELEQTDLALYYLVRSGLVVLQHRPNPVWERRGHTGRRCARNLQPLTSRPSDAICQVSTVSLNPGSALGAISVGHEANPAS
jgi:hypothetical protein